MSLTKRLDGRVVNRESGAGLAFVEVHVHRVRAKKKVVTGKNSANEICARARTDLLGRFAVPLPSISADEELRARVFDQGRELQVDETSARYGPGEGKIGLLTIQVVPEKVPRDHLFRTKLHRSLDLFSEPDGTKKVHRLSLGMLADVRSVDGEWVQIAYNDTVGWAKAKDAFSPVFAQLAAAEEELPLIEPGRLETLRSRLLRFAENEVERAKLQSLFDRLDSHVAWLQRLASVAPAYLSGDPVAEGRMLALAYPFQPLASATPTAGVFPFLQPGFPGAPHVPCLIAPSVFGRLIAAFTRVLEQVQSVQQGQHVSGLLQDRFAQSLDSLQRLESLNDMIERIPQDRSLLEDIYAVVRMETSGSAGAVPISGELPGGPGPGPRLEGPLPGSSEPHFLLLNPCGLERWRESENAVRCFCGERYEVTDIVSVEATRPDGEPYRRQGCPGMLVEIRGSGFGEEREWPVPGRHGGVLFAASGTRGVPVADEDYVSWSDTAIQVRVPDGARSGAIAVHAMCRRNSRGEAIDISACGVQPRPPAGGPASRYFEVPDAPEIVTFLAHPLRYDRGGRAVDAEGCDEVELRVEVRNAEQCTIERNDGVSIHFAEGEPGPGRTIEGIAVVTGNDDHRFTLRATNVCAASEASVRVVWLVRPRLTVPRNVRAGQTLELRVDHGCPPEALGLERAIVGITAEDPLEALINLPEHVVFERSESEKRFMIETIASRCALVTLHAEVLENEAVYTEPRWRTQVNVYDTPHITQVRTSGATVCTGFTFEIEGGCFSPHVWENTVRLIPRGDGDVLSNDDSDPERCVEILELRPGPESPGHDAVLVCRQRCPTGPHVYDVEVSHNGLVSNRVPLLGDGEPLPYPRPRVRFVPSRVTIPFGAVTAVTLSWDVDFTQRVELERVVGGRLGVGPERLLVEDFRAGCGTQSNSLTDRISVTSVYELRAVPIGGGRPETREVSVTAEGAPPRPTLRGVRRIRIFNCEHRKRTVHVWLLDLSDTLATWEDRGELRAAHDFGTCPASAGESVLITLEDEKLYDLRIVAPSLPTCRGNNPSLTNCWVERHIMLGDDSGIDVNHIVF